MNTENKFEWTDELVSEFTSNMILEVVMKEDKYAGVNRIEQFKKSKQQNTIQKDWEVISFIVELSRRVLDKTEEGDFGDYMFRIDENELLKSPNHKIHSVKRISDGEIFTIGDEAIYSNYLKFKITSIEISHRYNGIAVCGETTEYNINHIEKVKQPLFKTEDGVDVYKNDKIWCLNLKHFAHVLVAIIDDDYSDANYKYFLNIEALENYVLMNKPVLSVNEVSDLIKEIQELAKSKIEGK